MVTFFSGGIHNVRVPSLATSSLKVCSPKRERNCVVISSIISAVLSVHGPWSIVHGTLHYEKIPVINGHAMDLWTMDHGLLYFVRCFELRHLLPLIAQHLFH